MKSKRSNKRKLKGSLQKTSSTLINLYTHRNSTINQSIPLYNESILSLKTSSLNKNHQIPTKVDKNINYTSQNKLLKKKVMLRQTSHHHYQKNKQMKSHNLKQKSENASKYKKKNDKRNMMDISKRSQNKKSSLLTQSMNNVEIFQKNLSGNGMHDVLRRSKQILSIYKTYTTQLQNDRDRYKEKYRQTLTRLRRYQCK